MSEERSLLNLNRAAFEASVKMGSILIPVLKKLYGKNKKRLGLLDYEQLLDFVTRYEDGEFKDERTTLSE